MTKILVTGGAGFIGAHLTKKLSSNKKNKILVVDLLKNKGGISYLNPKNKFWLQSSFRDFSKFF